MHSEPMSQAKKLLSDDRLLTRTFFKLLPYQMLMIAISSVNSIVDSLYASNAIGKAAMSAIGLYNPINHFLYAAGMMLVSGAQILYGRYISKEHEHIQSIFSVNILFSTLLSLALTVLMALSAATGITRVFTTVEPDLTMFNQYLLGQSVGIIPLIVGQQLFAFLSLENQSKRTMTASIACFLVNAVMDHLLIVVFDMGILGLGLASALSAWVFFGIQAAWYLRGKSEWKLSLRSCHWRDLPHMIRLGYPGALSRFVEMFRCFIVNFLMLRHVGSTGLSSFAASNAMLGIFWALPFGMMAVSRMLFSISYGEEDRRSLIDTFRIVMTRGMLLMIGVSTALCLLAVPLTMMFYRDVSDPVYQMTVMGFRLLPWCMPLAVLSLIFASYAQVMEKKLFSVILPVCDGAVGVVLFSFLLLPSMGMNGLYIANILNGALCALLIVANAWIEKKHFPRSLEDLMAIPDAFGVPDDQRLDITVRNLEEVQRIAAAIRAFCRERNLDSRRTFYSALCMEEMAGNVVEHGFVKDRKTHSVDIRVSHVGEDIILRMRDDCVAFNPAEHARVMNPKNRLKDIGIRMVYSLAKEVNYQHLLNHNVLMMRI